MENKGGQNIKKIIIFRVDYGKVIGYGHIMRCIALAQFWSKDGGDVLFLTRSDPSFIKNKLSKASVVHISDEESSSEELLLIRDFYLFKKGWVVLDGYLFNEEYQMQLRTLGVKYCYIDDNSHLSHYFCDILLNQNIYANKKMYLNKVMPDTKLLIGPKYTLLRNEFIQYRYSKKKIEDNCNKILITFGGSDPNNITEKLLSLIKVSNIREKIFKIIIGPDFSSFQSLSSINNKVIIKKNVPNMAKEMIWADVAISSAGTTALELLFLGIPSIFVQTALNQKNTIEYSIINNLSYNSLLNSELPTIVSSLSQLISEPKKIRETLRYRGTSIIDGNGSCRVSNNITKMMES
jgi:UDP-2,4-diacetamido-2,4,6-trideoxy-beta-L-altropyranose hydrolase